MDQIVASVDKLLYQQKLKSPDDPAVQARYTISNELHQNLQELVASALLNVQTSVTEKMNEQIATIEGFIDAKLTAKATYEESQRKILSDALAKTLKSKSFDSSQSLGDNIIQAETQLRRKVARELIDSLWFSSITERIEDVVEAHRQTFTWIFEPTDMQKHDEVISWSKFVDWLRNDQSIYWINGKAGSGKSTLMKYLNSDPRTEINLKHWAGDMPLHIMWFFFWASGSKIQKTKIGLLRSLLYDSLRQLPEFAPMVLPNQWASRYAWESGLSDVRPVSASTM
jgi:hypothetical protein